MSDLFYPPRADTNSSSFHTIPMNLTTKHRQIMAPKASSQLGSDGEASTTNITGTPTTKSNKKATESRVFDDHVEEAISKAPMATQAMLKVKKLKTES